MKIICGTDFSVHAARAAEVGAALALRSNTELRLVHAIESARLGLLPAGHGAGFQERLRCQLVAEGNRLRATGARVMEKVVVGRPAEVLASAAAPGPAGLVVVSALGQGGPLQWLAGSVAEKTAQLAPVPTLCVRNHQSLRAWAAGHRPLKVLVGFDFSASAEAALHWVAGLSRIGPCRVTVVYVSWPPREVWRLGLGGASPGTMNPPEVQELIERDLQERCAQIFGRSRPTLRVVASWGEVADQLIETATAAAADLMVVGTHQRHGLKRLWLGSVSRWILHQAPMNVACVPAVALASRVRKPGPSFRRVLVPVDFSGHGNRAIALACGLAPRGGEICLVHVMPPAPGFKPRSESAAVWARCREELAVRLRKLVPEAVTRRGLRSRIEIAEHEHAAVAICQAAERWGADLICMGSRGRSRLKRKLLGSVTEAVMRRCLRPVVIFRG
jgi:nucleotide-binding universal stress UspA family protein